MPADDAELMRLIQQDQLHVFDELVSRHRSALCRVACSKLGDADWAEDVVQETFLAVYAARHTYDPQFAFRTWLWTILLNLCRRQNARRSRHPREVYRAEWHSSRQEPVSHETGLSHLLQVERQDELAALLDELPEAQADALRLRFFGELKFHEIAEATGCSLGGAKLRVRKGLENLAELLRRREAAPKPVVETPTENSPRQSSRPGDAP
jgi:RNA polymerase sigma-70 factor (ECF subfamily)